MSTENTSQAEDKVTFDEKQQERVNQLIREKQGEAAREVRTQLANTQTELEALRAELAEAKKVAAKSPNKGNDEDVETLKAQIAEITNVKSTLNGELERLKKIAAEKDGEVTKARAEVVNIRKQVAIQNAASKINFVDVSVVTKLTDEFVKYDENRGRFIVVNEQGTERMNSAFEPMSLDEFYNEYASKNPYLVRGDVRGGTGSSENQRVSSNGKYSVEQIFGPKSDGRLANELARTNKAEYLRLRQVAKEAGLVR